MFNNNLSILSILHKNDTNRLSKQYKVILQKIYAGKFYVFLDVF
jgi:hypothetical protein